MYTMDYERNKNVFHVVVSGTFKKEDGLSFVEDYKQKLKTFKAQDTTLIIESQDLKVSAQDMLETMKGCYCLYNSSGYKKMLIVLPTSATSALQARRMAKEAGYIGEFATSLDEAYSIASK